MGLESLLVSLLLMASCVLQATPAGQPTPGKRVGLARIRDGNWLFIPDRTGARWRTCFGSRGSAESDSSTMADSVAVPVTISDGVTRITLGGSPPDSGGIAGAVRSETGSNHLVFWLEYWGGGEFTIWAGGDSLHADITVSGFGVPVVCADKGRLVPVP